MADVHIDISNDESERFALYSGSIFELMIGSFSINMNADQFQQLCDNLRPWIIDDDAPAHPPAAAVPEGYALVPVEPTEAMLDAGHAAAWRRIPSCFDMTDAEIVYRAMLAAAAKGNGNG